MDRLKENFLKFFVCACDASNCYLGPDRAKIGHQRVVKWESCVLSVGGHLHDENALKFWTDSATCR